MLCKPQNAKKWALVAAILSFVLLNLAEMIWAPTAQAQTSSFQPSSAVEPGDGTISGTVLLKAGNRPASQVAVKLRSHTAGIFRSVLTDLEGHFTVHSLPPSTYEIVVDEPGYEPAQTSAQLDGASPNLVLYLKPADSQPAERSRYTVSARELGIPSKAQREYQKGLLCLQKRDTAGSLTHFTKAAEAWPEFYEAYYHVGVAQTALGHWDYAMRAFQKSIDLSGGRYAWGQIGIAYLLYIQEKTGEAEVVVRRALEVDGNSPDAYVLLGMIQLRQDQAEEAEKSGQEALLRNPNCARAYLVLADSYGRRKEYREQLEGLDAYLKLEPNGDESKYVRPAREVVLRVLSELAAKN
jgi:tetratricopeptide (TPR) repeat protein